VEFKQQQQQQQQQRLYGYALRHGNVDRSVKTFHIDDGAVDC
jgi:hypothetical protein